MWSCSANNLAADVSSTHSPHKIARHLLLSWLLLLLQSHRRMSGCLPSCPVASSDP